MPWRALTTDDCKFTPAELALLQNQQGGTDGLAKRLDDTIKEFIGAMNATGYTTVADGSVPDQLRGHVLARTTWQFLADFPALKSLLTENRKTAAEKAEAMLEAIAKREAGAIESPTPATSGTSNWNSEPRLVMRTHPIPTPAQQTGSNKYANPNAPGDT